VPRFSAFTPFGQLAFSSKLSLAERIYRSMKTAESEAFDLSVGTHEEAKLYARARGMARAGMALERAGNQALFSKATDLLPLLEADYAIVPGARDGLNTRRVRGAAAERLSRGAALENIVASLRTMLGTSFLAVRTLTPAEATVYPAAPYGDSRVNALAPTTQARHVKLTDGVTTTGVVGVGYENLDSTQGDVKLLVGDVVMVEPENTGRSEKVTIIATATLNGQKLFVANFARPHDIGAIVTNTPWPYQWSTKRFYLVVVTASAAVDQDKRRLVDEFMRRCVPATSQWAIVQPTSPGALTIGPFTLGSSPLGAVPLGTTAFTLSP
jgi:hypothetical protein